MGIFSEKLGKDTVFRNLFKGCRIPNELFNALTTHWILKLILLSHEINSGIVGGQF